VSSEPVFVALIARRRFIDRRRRTQRRLDTEPLGMDSASTAQSAEQVTEAHLAGRALDQLRPEQRQVVVLSTCHGMSHEEISQAIGDAARNGENPRSARSRGRA